MCIYVCGCPSFLLLVVILSARISIHNSLTHSLSLILLTRHETRRNTQSNRENVCNVSVRAQWQPPRDDDEADDYHTTTTGDNNSQHRTNQHTLRCSLSSIEYGAVYRNRISNRIIIFSHGSRRICVLTLFMWIQSEYAEQQKKNKKTKNKKKIKKKKKKEAKRRKHSKEKKDFVTIRNVARHQNIQDRCENMRMR